MTKKEQAAFAALELKLKLMAAMRWTDHVPPDVPPPTSFDKDSTGWLISPHSDYQWVARAWSSRVSHGRFYKGQKDGASQNAKWLYSSKVKALRAARHDVVEKIAQKLAEMDAEIEKAEAEEAENGNENHTT